MLGRKRLEEWQAMRKRDDTRKNEIMHMLETQQAEYGNVRRPAQTRPATYHFVPVCSLLCVGRRGRRSSTRNEGATAGWLCVL